MTKEANPLIKTEHRTVTVSLNRTLLKSMMKKRKTTLSMLARRMGVTPAHISNLMKHSEKKCSKALADRIYDHLSNADTVSNSTHSQA